MKHFVIGQIYVLLAAQSAVIQSVTLMLSKIFYLVNP